MTSALIFDAIRTPRGRAKKGAFAQTKPVDLVAPLMSTLAERFDVASVEDVRLGCVTQTGGQGSDIAKVAALYAGWPESIGGTTVNRFCASGLTAVADAGAYVGAGMASLSVAGGVESMSTTPMFADEGPWFADPEVSKKTKFVHMAVAADLYATLEDVDKDTLDAYGARSHARAARARDEGRFRALIPVGGLDRDESIRDEVKALPAAYAKLDASTALERYPQLERVEARHSLGTSPALTDAASLVLVGDQAAAERLGAKPRARIVTAVAHSTEPVLMLDGNVEGTRRALARAKMETSDVDVFEVNESFAVVPVVYERTFGLDPEKLNPNGGAIAMGHPLGATGGILVATALDELERADKSVALVSIVGGAGVTSTLILERV